MTFRPISEAPLDREVELKGVYHPSPEAARHGAMECDLLGRGRAIHLSPENHSGWHWSGILGGNPTHFREIGEG